MKLFFLLALFFLPFVGWCNHDQKIIDGDSLLLKLQKNLPAGWAMRTYADTLVIENLETVWMLQSNYINAPQDAFNDSEKNKSKITLNGKKTHAHFIFQLIKKPKKNSKVGSRRDETLHENSLEANYYSENYGLMEIKAVGFDHSYARFYPWNIADDAEKIYFGTLGECLKKGKGPVYPEVNYERP